MTVARFKPYKRRRAPYLGVGWRGKPMGKIRLYRGQKHREFIPCNLDSGSPWVGHMRWVIRFKGRISLRSKRRIRRRA